MFLKMRRSFASVLLAVTFLVCYELYIVVNSGGRRFMPTARSRRYNDNQFPTEPPSAHMPKRSKHEDACFPYGTDFSASGVSCVCLKGWNGESCSVPQAVWDSPSFQTWYRDGRIKHRLRPRTIINSFVFNHELDLLEIRVNQLGDAVDYYLACESNFTYFGDPKPLHLRSNLSAGFLSQHRHKIVDLQVVTHFVGNGNPWAPENYLRSYIWKEGRHRFKNLSDDDLFLISDADEIPSREVMLFLKYHDGFGEPISLGLRWFLYGFFWEQRRPVNVSGVCTVAYLRDVLHNDSLLVRRGEFQAMEATTNDTGTVWIPWTLSGSSPAYAGWHCSWCFDVAGIQVKLASANRDDGVRWGDIAEKRDEGYIRSLRRAGRYFDNSPPLRKVDAYEAAPSYLREDVERWRYLLRV